MATIEDKIKARLEARAFLLMALPKSKIDLIPLVENPVRLKVLKTLVENPEGIHIRALIRKSGTIQRTVYAVIDELARQGLLLEVRKEHERGRPRVIKLNPNHPDIKIIKALVEAADFDKLEALVKTRGGKRYGRGRKKR